MENWIPTLLVLIPALPLAGAAVTAALGARWLRGSSHLPVVAGIAGAFVAAVALLFAVRGGLPATDDHAQEHSQETIGYEQVVTLWSWAAIGDAYDQETDDGAVARDFRVDVTLRADPLTAIMLSMVTFISLLVAVYAIGYMHDDRWLLAILQLHRFVRLFHDDARFRKQLRVATLRVLGGSWALQLFADRILVRETRGCGGRQEGLPGESHRRFRFRPRDCS